MKLNFQIFSKNSFYYFFILIIITFSLWSCKSFKKKKTNNFAYKRYKGLFFSNPTLEKKQAVVTLAKGYSVITKAGEQDAYDRALEHALRNAVEQVLGTMVQASTLVKNNTLIDNKIYNQSRGYVQKYIVVDEFNQKELDENVKKLKIEAYIVKSGLEDDLMSLGLLYDRANLPYLVVLSDEMNIVNSSEHLIKNEIQNYFIQKGFQFLQEDKLVAITKQNLQNKKNILKLSKDELLPLFNDQEVQIMIRVKLNSEQQKIVDFENTGIKSVRSAMDIEIFYINDGHVIFSKGDTFAGAALSLIAAESLAVKKGMKLINREIFNTIIEFWNKISNDGVEYTISISGINFNESVKIESFLNQSIEGIKNIFTRGFQDNEIKFVVRYTGKIFRLGSLISSLSKDRLGYTLAVQKIASKKINLKKN